MKSLRVLTITNLFPLQDNRQNGEHHCLQAEVMRELGVEWHFLVLRPWAPWPLWLHSKWRPYRRSNRLAGPDFLPARETRYLRPPGFWFVRHEGRLASHSAIKIARDWHRQQVFDVVMGINLFPGGEVAVQVGHALSLPVATLSVGSDLLVHPDRDPRLLQRVKEMLGAVDLPIGISESICESMRRIGTCRREPLCCFLARREDIFYPAENRQALRAELGWKEGEVIALFVGNLYFSKGIEELSAAARQLLPVYPQLKLICLGDGPARSSLETVAEGLDRKNAIVLPGRVRPDEVARYLQAADFLVFPSHSEGMGMVAVEAMKCRLPVVATAVGGIPEAVVDGHTGLLVEPHNVDQLVDAMRRMIDDKTFRHQAGEAGLALARSKFNSLSNARKMAEAFKTLVNSK